MSIAQKLRDMHALAANSCDPEFNRALLEAADEIDRLRAALGVCAAPWSTRPGTMLDCFAESKTEFERRMGIAQTVLDSAQG